VTATFINTIGRALLAGTLRVDDLDFPADQVTCLSIVLTPVAATDHTCVIYRDGSQASAAAGKPIGCIAAITPLLLTTAGEPFTFHDLRQVAGLAGRLQRLIDDRGSSGPGIQHHHVYEHWMGGHAEIEPSTHSAVTHARLDATARAERHRARGYQVEGNPLVGFVISHLADICVIQVTACHGPTCGPETEKRRPEGKRGT
jgi:hypothetical protein